MSPIKYYTVLYTSGVLGAGDADKPTLLKTKKEADAVASRVAGAKVVTFDANFIKAEDPAVDAEKPLTSYFDQIKTAAGL